MYDNSFEKIPGESVPSENELRAAEWQSAMNADDVPAFAGDVSMRQENPSGANISGDVPNASPDEIPSDDISESTDNTGISDAASIINYGLNAAAKEYGVETVVQKIKSFDATGSENPIRDLFGHLGVDTPTEVGDVKMEREAAKPAEADFYQNSEAAPQNKNRSPEGAFKAIQDMKELITEVEGADPRYQELRQNAASAGKGYFEYAVGSNTNRGLTDLFNALAAEPKAKETAPENPDVSENPAAPGTSENSSSPENPETLNPEILRDNSPEAPTL